MGRLYDAFIEVGPKFTGMGDIKKQGSKAGQEYGKALADAAAKAAAANVRKLGEALANARSKEADAAGKVRVAEEKLNEVRSNSKAKASQVAAAEEALAAAQRKSAKASDVASGAAKSLDQARDKVSKAAETTGKAGGNRFTSGFRGALSKFKPDQQGKQVMTRFGVGLNGAIGSVVSKSAGIFAAGFAAVKVGGLAKEAVNLEATFSQTMNTMAAVAKVPADQIKTLSDLAIKMGADTTFSASEAAGAMLELAKGGLSAATIQSGALEGTLTLAAAGGTDLATASTIASNALNTFGLQGKDMASVAAALAGGANASSASVESLGEALSQVGPGATTAGLTLQDTVGVLSSFDAAGIKGSDAGTSLKTMLTRLVPSTDAAKSAMEQLGLKFTDANGKFVPITNVAQQLKDKLSGLSDEQKTAALSTIFGSDATRAATVLMKEGATGLGKYIAATKDQGAAQDVATARMKGTAGAMESFKGSVETAKLQLGLFLAPAIQGGLRALTKMLNGIAPAAKRLGPTFATLKTGIQAFGQAFKGEGVTSDGFVGVMEHLGVSARAVFGFFKTEILPRLKEFGGYIKTTVIPIVGQLIQDKLAKMGQMFGSIKNAIQDNRPELEKLGGVLLNIGKFVIEKVAPALQMMNNNVFPSVGRGASFVIRTIGFLIKAFDAIQGAVTAAFNGVKSAITTSLGAVGTAVNAVKSAFSTAFTAVTSVVTTVVGAVSSAFTTAVGFVKTKWGEIVAAVSGPVNAVLGVLDAVWSRISPILVLPFYIAKKLISVAFNGILAGFTAAKNWVVGAFSAAWSAVSGVLAGPLNYAGAVIKRSWALIVAAFNTAKGWVTGAFASAWSAVKSVVAGPLAQAKAGLDRTWALVKAAFNTAKNFATGAFASAWAGLKSIITTPITLAKNALTTILGAAKGGVQWIFKQAVSGISKVWNGLQELAKKPIRFIIDTVLNKGLIAGFNWIAGKFDAPQIAPIPMPKGFASGGFFDGRLPGPPSSKDNLLGYAKGGAFGLAGGEMVVNAKDTKRTLPLLKHINDGGSVPGFADGGLIGTLKSGISKGFNAAKDFGSDALGFLKDPVKWFKDRFAGPLGRLGELGNSPVAQIASAVPRKLADTIAGKAKSLLGLGGGGFNASLAGVLSFVKSQVGKPYVWGGVGPGGYDCSGLVSAAINVALGKNPYSRVGATGSMPWGVMAPGAGAFSIGWFKGNPGHTAATVNGTNIESSGGVGVHMGPGARGANNSLFTNIAHLKGFAQGGRVGDDPFDLLSPRGKHYVGGDMAARLRAQLHELHMGHVGHQAHVSHLNHLNHRAPSNRGPKPIGVYDKGGRWPSGTIGVNTSGKTETVIPGDGQIELSDRSLQKLAGLLAGMSITLDGRRLDAALSRSALGRGY